MKRLKRLTKVKWAILATLVLLALYYSSEGSLLTETGIWLVQTILGYALKKSLPFVETLLLIAFSVVIFCEYILRESKGVPKFQSFSSLINMLLPRRVSREDAGDFLEELSAWEGPRWKLYFWIAKRVSRLVANGLVEAVAQLLMRIAGKK
jgi:hypothetical protein